nr:ribonuclease H-like domain-containing protein [Tanacetum cinerariifolium]
MFLISPILKSSSLALSDSHWRDTMYDEYDALIKNEPHLVALKRIIHYVHGTLKFGLQLYASSRSSLMAYSDAYWAGCAANRISTSSYMHPRDLLLWLILMLIGLVALLIAYLHPVVVVVDCGSGGWVRLVIVVVVVMVAVVVDKI